MLKTSTFPFISKAIAAAALLVPLMAAAPAQSAGSFTNVDVTFKGAGWLKSGMVMHSTDTVTGNLNYYNNYNKNWMQDAGVLFTGIINLNEQMEAAFGIGAIQKHPVQGVLKQAKDVKLGLNIFSTQSRISWYPVGKKDPKHKFDFGLFPYKYDSNIKNLGLYLIRGPVYPGILVSGFEAKEMLNTANMMGAHMMNRFGPYTQDLVLTSEQDFKPLFDISAIYVGTLKLGTAFEVGGGVNFYHYLPVRSDVTSPSAEAGFDPTRKLEGQAVSHAFDSYYAVNVGDSANPVYTWAEHKGIKLMGRFALDPQALMGPNESLSKTDLKLYGEVGIIGTRNYKGIYDKIAERIPLMLGFNIPTFKVLDVLALEVEYYGSKIVPDFRKLNEEVSAVPQSPWINRAAPDSGAIPYSQMEYPAGKDDIKWSLYFSKVFAGHVKISGQAANDHFRTGGTPGLAGKSYEEALTDLKDWYWFLKLSYFF